MAGVHVAEAETLLLFQRKQICLLQITSGQDTLTHFRGEIEVCPLSKQLTIDEDCVIAALKGINKWTIRILSFRPNKGLLEEAILQKPVE